MARWTTADSEELYQVQAWSQGWFSVNEQGNLNVAAPGQPGGLDLKVLVDDLRRRGIAMPVLIRFSDLIWARIEEIVGAFQRAGKDYDWKGQFRGVYPIKVTQDAHVLNRASGQSAGGAAANLGHGLDGAGTRTEADRMGQCRTEHAGETVARTY